MNLSKEILKILEINTGELFTFLGTNDFCFSTLLRKPYNLIAKYDNGKIYLAEQVITSNCL